MCQQCDANDEWSVKWATVKNAGEEMLYLQDAYTKRIRIIEPGQTVEMQIRVTRHS